MKPPPLLLMNCRQCDDVLKLVGRIRVCECASSSGRESDGQALTDGPCRVLAIDWEQYDGAVPREPRTWFVTDDRFPW